MTPDAPKPELVKHGGIFMPGATLLTRLNVYDTPGPDGQKGGTPHVHLICTELYYVLSGSGAVEIIDKNGFSRVELKQHGAYLFTSGTIHRLINPHGDLELLIVMQNSGLPERGDNIVTFPAEVLGDPSRFATAMKAERLSDALWRRDRGVEGFLELKSAFERSAQDGRRALDAFYKLCMKRTTAHHKDWYARVTHGAFQDAQDSLFKIIEATAGRIDYLHAAKNELIEADENTQLGFCGSLDRYFDSGSLLMDGERKF